MARWLVFAEYGGEGFEVEVQDPDLETEQDVVESFLEFVQIWVEKVDE